ncbi:unnamed protein product [Rotaria magnacalcarata]
MPGNAGFYSSNTANTPWNVKFKSKQKFEPKVLVWLALSSKGISVPYIGTTDGPAIDSNLYVQKCLPKLLAFIRRYHADNNYIFWPDLASSHYAKNHHYMAKSTKYTFCAKTADKVYHGGWLATTEQQLINRIKQQLKKFDLKIVQTMMLEVRKKLRKIEQQGPFSIL